MVNSISGKHRVVNAKPYSTGVPTEENAAQRLLNKENMKRLDLYFAANRIADGHRRFSSEQPAYIIEVSESAKAHSQGPQTDDSNAGVPGQNQGKTGMTKDASSAEDPKSIVQRVLDLQKEAQEKLRNSATSKTDRTIDAAAKEDGGRPPDETLRLTRMLVAARSSIEVQSVLAEAFNHMQKWQQLAAEGDKKAMAVIKKINKLVSRGTRKIRDLNKEQVMLQRQKKAEKAKQEQIARRLRDELKQTERLRKQRERRYLQERDDYKENEPMEFGPSMTATEARIRALAASMAALSANSTDTGAAGLGDNMAAEGGAAAEGADVSEGAEPSELS